VTCYPENLPFANHLCRLDALNDCPRRGGRPWPLHGAQSTLDVTVIRFDPVIGVFSVLASDIPERLTCHSGAALTSGLATMLDLAGFQGADSLIAVPTKFLSDSPGNFYAGTPAPVAS